MKKIIEYVLLGYLVIYLTGCAALIGGAAVGAGTYLWLENRIQREVDTSLTQTVDATRTAMQGLNLDITEQVLTDEYAQFQGRYYNQEPLWIDLYKVSPDRTQIQIRVGIPGNEAASRNILDNILAHLPK